jgi:outer membrane protein assembly factor BamB
MSKDQEPDGAGKSNQPQSLRLWPGIAIVVLQWLFRFVFPVLMPGDTTLILSVFGTLLGGLAIVLWWAFFSRAPWRDRLIGVVLMLTIVIVTRLLIHKSIETGLQGMMFFVYVIPGLSLGFVIWAVTSHRLSDRARWATMLATILLTCGFWLLFRSDGITGDIDADFAWRWAKTHEERLLAETIDEPLVLPPEDAAADSVLYWPGFRGHNRDGIISGIRIATDWSVSEPVELWRRLVGPGCSSFAVRGNLLYTQEQRGEDEVVSCYNIYTGQPAWRHLDNARFWDSHAGAGPRGTPTLSGDRLYALGATGILNVLDARDGSLIWSRNAVTDSEEQIPGWGIASSPLVVDDVVIVAVASRLVAYDIMTGEPRWFGSDSGENYSSPHLLTLDGVPQVVLMSNYGATSFAPADGKILWQHAATGGRIVQPAQIADGEMLMTIGSRKGLRRLTISHKSSAWHIEEDWTSTRLRPEFNDFVIHKDHVFGFEGLSLACIDIESGKRKWKGGHYGGQFVLLADQDLLLVLSEKGELVLVAASPDQFKEIARYPAIEGKTWNHPVLVGDILVVRNTQEMAAFRLPLMGN